MSTRAPKCLTRVLAALALLPAFACAGTPADYAMQWPLVLASEEGSAAHRVVLDEDVYRVLQTPDLRDLAVLNADGVMVPASLVSAEPPAVAPPVATPVPWFALSRVPPAASGEDWQLISQVDASGRLSRVEVRGEGGASGSAVRTTLLVDLGGIQQPVAALDLIWEPVAALDLGYRIDASDDLEHWRLHARGQLLDLRQDGHRLLQRRIELPRSPSARYLRLTPEDAGQIVEIIGVDAVLASATVAAAPEWLALAPVAATHPGQTTFEYELAGRFPVRQVDVAMAGNHANEWRLESRDDPDADWRLRAGPWMAYQVGDAGARSRSHPRVLGDTVRDRYWRLRTGNGATPTPPTLKLGYRPEAVVFLAQGAPPYRLVAGSARARRADSPLPELIAALREQHGSDWRPVSAGLGPPRPLAGDAALVPVRDWKAWLLWGVLGLGSLLVAGFALSLLRAPGRPTA